MPDNYQTEIVQLISTLRQRTHRTYEQARDRMATLLGIVEYDRSTFDNKFRRTGRSTRYELDEVRAIIRAYYDDLPPTKRCTAYEAISLFELTGLRLEDHHYLKALYGEVVYTTAWRQFLHEHDLAVVPENTQSLRHVFISHSDEDVEIANRIRQSIEAGGYRVWQEAKGIPGGREWLEQVEQGINGSCALAVITSSHLTANYWVWEEILHAKRRNKQIIPFVVEDTPLPFGMLQVDRRINAHSDFEAGVRQLLQTLEPCLDSGVKRVDLSRRQSEIDYLDHVLLEYGIWKTAYTPLAGTAMRTLITGTTEIKTIDLPIQIMTDFDLYIDEKLSKPQAIDYQDDILRAIDDLRQFLILGDPGAGKTATLRHIAARFAELAKADEMRPLPVLIDLSLLEGHHSLREKIETQLGNQVQLCDDLFQAKRIALLVDGLNEIPHNVRESVLNDIRNLAKTAKADQIVLVVACRTADYSPELEMDIAGQVVINPLDPFRIWQIVSMYIQDPIEKRDEFFWALAGADARRCWDRFVLDVGNEPAIFWLNEQLPDGMTWGYGEKETAFFYWKQWLSIRRQPQRLLQLASNPLMLYMLMRVFVRHNHLPANRSKLLETFIDFLLKRRTALSSMAINDLVEKLAALAYNTQLSENYDHLSVELVQQYLGNQDALRSVQSASIIVTDGLSTQFTHQLIQEYLAAQKLTQQIQAGVTASKFWPSQAWWLASGWEETVILSTDMFESDTTPIITWLQDANPEVAARCIAESGSITPDSLIYNLAARWVNRLNEVPAAARVSVGRALGIVGNDPRSGVGLNPAGLPDIEWVEIADGEFIYGDGEKCYERTFTISRYPITYIQFQAFIDADDGFYHPAWWQHLARQEQSPGIQSFPYSNHPRERVNWYDAVAFCRWLSYHLGYSVSLPTEYQWEKAARGPEGYVYPYGNAFNPESGNVDQTAIGKTSAVGLFPEGASPYGVLDMSGNVFEWCVNTAAAPDETELDSDSPRSLRGGSWAHSLEHARANYRYANRPDLRRSRVGFRVICEV